jgi:hypothetical protein
MGTKSDPLRSLKVASPCRADWDTMYGDDRVRHCGECKLNVYNLSNMTRAEAERLIAAREGRLCVRFYRRKDGTVITKDCPVGLAAVRRRVARVATAVAGFVLGAFTGAGATLALRGDDTTAGFDGYQRTMGTIAVRPTPPPTPPVMGEVGPTTGVVVIQGNVSAPPPPASPPKAARRAHAR